MRASKKLLLSLVVGFCMISLKLGSNNSEWNILYSGSRQQR